MRSVAILSVALGILASGVTWAIQGCLTGLEDLVPRAQHIVLGRVTDVIKIKLAECQEGGVYWEQSNRCDGLYRLSVTVSERIRGDAPQELSVVVGSDGPLALSCDDRPPVNGMQSLTVLLFLETDRDRYWTLDGPNSIYAWPGRTAARDETSARVRALIADDARSGDAGS
jgi:hypothetical protein